MFIKFDMSDMTSKGKEMRFLFGIIKTAKKPNSFSHINFNKKHSKVLFSK